MDWRLAGSLIQIRTQVNAGCPDRSKLQDGTIGNEEHASRSSDHNPWVIDSHGQPVVTAEDFTHDPRNGFDSYKFADWLKEAKDPRVKYLISNRRISNPSIDGGKWRKYNGTNAHDLHCHISVSATESLFDSKRDWELTGFGFKPVKSAPPVIAEIVLAKGTRGKAVEELQTLLKMTEIDGHFGPKTDAAVRLFQKMNGLEPDGVVGLYTWQKLKKGRVG
jgi:peptidoglycan hydrolase-like protein with peptidoglycan-binding domain